MGNWARTCYFDQREKMLGRCSTNSSQLWFKFNDLSHPVIKNERECEKWKISKWKKQISAWTLEGNSKLSTAACFFKPLNRTLVQFFSKRFGISRIIGSGQVHCSTFGKMESNAPVHRNGTAHILGTIIPRFFHKDQFNIVSFLVNRVRIVGIQQRWFR